MKKLILSLSFLFTLISLPLLAQNVVWEAGSSNPVSLLDAVVGQANQDQSIQDTKLDGITSTAAGYSANPQYRITNTLEYVKNNIHPYLQWVMYIGLSLAVILLIWNGFLMVTNVTHGQGELSKVKGNFINIGIGVVILTGFYYLIDIILAVINLIFA